MIRTTTEELLHLLKNRDLKLIDIRPVEAYNGWKLNNEIRGGHIETARSLPFKWIQYLDWLDIVQSKEIMSHHALIVYGYDPVETEKVASQFLRAGYQDVKVYHEFVNKWSANPKLPISRLKRYRQLVSAQWLKSLIQPGDTAEYDNNKYVICHAHYQNKCAYDEGHIPGAIEVDTNTLESSKTWNRRSSQEIKETLESLGITHDTTVILYGRFSFPDNNDPFPGSSAGHLGAIRCAFIMMLAGVKDVRVLNSGLQSWIDETASKSQPKKRLNGP